VPVGGQGPNAKQDIERSARDRPGFDSSWRVGAGCARLAIARNASTTPSAENVLRPVVERYKGKLSRNYFRADAGFANPEVYEFLEAERIKYAIRLPANRILQERIGHLLTRPIGRPPNEVRLSYANFTYQAGSWTKPRRVVAKVEWHPGELYPRVGFIVTNMARPAENVVAFYNKRGTCEQ
jgi:Transposase DDE domain group 1